MLIDTDSNRVHRCRPSSPVPCHNDSSSGYTVCCCCRRTRCNGTGIPEETSRNSPRRCRRHSPCRRHSATTCWRTAYYCNETRWARIRADLSENGRAKIAVWDSNDKIWMIDAAARSWKVLTAPHLVGSVSAVVFAIAHVRFGNAVAVTAGCLVVLTHLRWSGRRLFNCGVIKLIMR